MSDTPRTDEMLVQQEAAGVSIWDALTSIQNFARTLEREIAALKAQLAEARDEANAAWLSHGELTHTVETLRAQLATARDDEARECLDIAWQHNSCEGIAQNIAAAIERRIQERAK